MKLKIPTFRQVQQKFEVQRLILVLLVAFAIRLLLAFFETEVGVDSVHYILMGDNIAHLKSFDTWNTTGGRWILPPALPLLIAIFRLIGFGLEWSGHLATVVAGTFLLLPIYWLTRHFHGELTARIATVIAAFYPILVDYSVVILTENLFAAFVLMALVLIARAFAKDGKPVQAFWSGFWLGLAFLTKTFGIFLLPFLLLSYMFGRGGHSKNKPMQMAGLALLGFLVLAVPYWIIIHQATGEWTIDGKGTGQASRVFAANLTDEHIDPRYTGELTSDGSDFLINVDPSALTPEDLTPFIFTTNYLKKYVQKLVRIYQDFPFAPTYPNNVLLFYLFPVILMSVGFFSGPGRWTERHSDRFILYWLCPFLFGIPLIFVEVRYYIPVIPLLIPFMARGVIEIAEWAVTRFTGSTGWFTKPLNGPAITLILAIFILLAMPKLLYKVTNWNDPMISYNPRAEAATWLERSGYQPERIMEYAHSVSFYSGAQSILIPDGDLDDLTRIAREYDVDLISLDEFYVLRGNRRPEIEYLFSTNNPPYQGLERIYVDELHPGLKHVIYRILPRPQDLRPTSDPE